MAIEPKTGLTVWPSGALQQDLLFNALLKRFAIVGGQPSVLDKDLATPPGSPVSGATYIVAATPTGAWTGKTNNVAYWNGVSWEFYAPASGDRWQIYVVDEATLYRWSGSAWAPSGAFTGGSLATAVNEAKGADIASATTTDIGAATGNFVHITGTTTITALGTIQAGTRRKVRFAGILTLTHNATSLILPTGANITTAANDCAEFISEGSGNWRCTDYSRADGTSLGGSPGSVSSVNGATGAVVLGGESIAEPVTTLSISSGVVAINCALGDYFTLAAAAAMTSFTFSNLPASGKAQTIMVRITQDATGSRLATWPSSFKWAGGTAGVLSTVASSVDVLAITTFDQGTRWEATLAKAFA